ncbi:MAG: hypothetical protein RL293_106, partial [Bacteroidota bacterium]
QDDYAFDMTSRIYAEAGYAVANVNYRGSSGRGVAFTNAIYADWGNKEVIDIVGAADYLIKEGIAEYKIHLTGNTVIDTLLAMTKKNLTHDFNIDKDKKLIRFCYAKDDDTLTSATDRLCKI